MEKGMAESFFDITEYGAGPDGKTLCTKAFEQAVSAAAECGGTVWQEGEERGKTGKAGESRQVCLALK